MQYNSHVISAIVAFAVFSVALIDLSFETFCITAQVDAPLLTPGKNNLHPVIRLRIEINSYLLFCFIPVHTFSEKGLSGASMKSNHRVA